MSDHAQTSSHACIVRVMAFTQTWSNEVREAVERLALDPQRLSAKRIHSALAVGAVDGITGEMVPPASTVARWVHDHRRTAREVIGATSTDQTMTHVLAKLREQLRRKANGAKTVADIRAVASAAREVAALERELGKVDGRTVRKPNPRDLPTAAPLADVEQREFLETLARDAGRSYPSEGERTNNDARGSQHIADTNEDRNERAAAS